MAERRDKDPFPAFRFQVELDGLKAGFSECTGIGLETEVFEYAEGGVNDFLHKLPTRTKQSNVTLKRGIVDRAFWDWYFQVTQGRVELKSGGIVVLDEEGKRAMEFSLRRAYPCKLQGPDLNATQNNVAVETLEICHHGLTRDS